MTAVLLNPRQQVFSRQDLIPRQPDRLWRIERGMVRTVVLQKFVEDRKLLGKEIN